MFRVIATGIYSCTLGLCSSLVVERVVNVFLPETLSLGEKIAWSVGVGAIGGTVSAIVADKTKEQIDKVFDCVKGFKKTKEEETA